MQVIDFTSADRIMSEGHTSKGDQPKWKQSGNWYKACLLYTSDAADD